MQNSHINQELGFHPEEGYLATETLSPVIQTALDNGRDSAAVLVALADIFFLHLGATTNKSRAIDQAAKRFHKKIKRHGYDRKVAKHAVEKIGDAATQLAGQGISNRAVCYSLAAAIIRIVRMTPGFEADSIAPLTIELLTQINMAPAT